jgi:hypothetical protein
MIRSLFSLARRTLRDPITAFQVDTEIKDIKQALSLFEVYRGKGSPEGEVKGSIGALYINLDGGASTTLYIKESDDKKTTGWVEK